MSDLGGSEDVGGVLGRSAERLACVFSLKKRPLANCQKDKYCKMILLYGFQMLL